RSPVEFAEQARHLALAVRDTEFLLDDPSDTGTRPDFAPEPISLRAMPQELRELAPLGRRQLGDRARGRAGEQGRRCVPLCRRQPPTDGPFRDAEGGGDVALLPTLLLQVQGSHPPPLLPIMRLNRSGIHAPF